MPQVLRLTVLTGPHRGEKFCFRATAEALIGRAAECFVQLAGTERDQFISRRHCQLQLDPSSLTLQDLGSLCGTYLDGERIELAILPLPPCTGCNGREDDDVDFDHGQLLTIGGTTLRIDRVDCPPKDTPEAEKASLWKRDETAKKDCPVPCR
jgi:pSer/pThr/pTyr-binding forkhead associated (FHA) protein